MIRFINPLFVLVVSVLLQSCSFQAGYSTKKLDPKEVLKEIKENLQGFKVSNINLDYIGRCKVQIKTKSENQSGSCQIIVTRFGAMKITLFSPIGGTVFTLYLDKEIIQALDQTQKVFYRLKNTQKNRLNVFAALNFDVREFQSIIWGRETDWAVSRLKYFYQGGQPVKVETIGNDRKIVVTYKTWLTYEGVRFPKIFIIEDKIRRISIKMVITEFKPGYVHDLKIKNIPSSYHIQSDI